jgi:AGZA family xanthine/uracil permease-like MFS transporter
MLATIGSYFEIDARRTTITRELRGAVATFLTMAYILVANPAIIAGAGVPFDSAVACTAAAAGIGCLLMGLGANFPVAMASGMGLNAVAVYQIARVPGGSWEKAMGLIMIDGLIIVVLVLCGLREAIMQAIPRDLRRAIGAGIGLFIALIGAVNAKLVIVPASTVAALHEGTPPAPMPPVTFGQLQAPEATVAVIGLLVTAFLIARRVRGAIILGILVSTIAALFLGLATWPGPYKAPNFEIVGKVDIPGVLNLEMLPMLLAFLLVDFFDALGTVTGIAEQAGLHDEQGRIPGLRNVLIVDGLGASIGGFFGVSSATAYIESAAGVAEGARTGLSAVVVGLFFLGAIFLAPYLSVIPLAATAPALILVGFLMCTEITKINFNDPEIGIPAFVTLVLVPFTYSIAHGIGYGFITFVAIKVLSLKFREVHPLMVGTAILFTAYFIWDR